MHRVPAFSAMATTPAGLQSTVIFHRAWLKSVRMVCSAYKEFNSCMVL